MIVKFFDFFKKEPQMCKTCGYVLAALILLWSIFFVQNRKSHFSLENFPGFWTLLTLITCIVLVFFVKIYGKTGFEKEEEYYD